MYPPLYNWLTDEAPLSDDFSFSRISCMNRRDNCVLADP